MNAQHPFDPDSAARPESGLFGLPHSRDEARIVVVPVEFEATVSYGTGTAAGPEAIVAASKQVDLCDADFGRVYRHGIFMEPPLPGIRELSSRARQLAEPIIERGGAGPGDDAAVEEVEAACEWVRRTVAEHVRVVLREEKIPGVLGGEHSVSLGAIEACAGEVERLGVLQIDAHLDLREAYEGFRHSHASVMFNVLSEVGNVERVVQVGIRDFAEGEWREHGRHGDRIVTLLDRDLHRARAEGQSLIEPLRAAIESLPGDVYVTFDIDGLDPALCPHTGTPVAGGLSFNDAALLLELLAASGRRVIGFDLVEVAPGPGGDEWDANVGARVLYKLCGCAAGAIGYR